MIASGALTENDDVELLEGWLVSKMPRDPHRDGSLMALQHWLTSVLPPEWIVRVQSAVVTKDSEPEPDLAIVSAPLEKYFEHHPGRADIALVVEIANTSLEDDRAVKGRIYARERFPEYWIVNLIARRIEVYSAPRAGKHPSYHELTIYDEGASAPLKLDKKVIGRIAVRDVLPPRSK